MDTILEDYPWECYETLPNATKRKLETTLLLEIVEKSNSTMNSRYLIRKNCEDLLRENAPFRRILLKCWLIGSFEDLLTAEELQPLSSAPPVEHDLTSTDMQLNIQNASIYGGKITQVHGNLITHNYSSRSEKERQDLMNWLSDVDYARIHNDIVSKRVPDTGEWFILSSEVETWIDEPSARILWCPGIPGVGKTVLSSLVVDHLEKERKMSTCVIYLNYKRVSTQSLSHLFASMLRQLYANETLPCEPVDNLWDAYSSHKSIPSEDELYATLLETLEALESMTYLVLDALDEYVKQYSDDLIDTLLSKLTTANPERLKIMVTSRVIGGMEQLFSQAGALRREIFSADNDIARYIHYRATRELSFMTKTQVDELKQRILGLTKGRFLVAHLHMNSLSALLNWGEIKDGLDHLSGDIDIAYEGVMRRINDQDQRRRELANKVLLWVACAKQNLSIKDIQFALAIAPGRKNVRDYLYSVDTITSVCTGLVIADQENGVVRFMHQTAQEFFESARDVYFSSPDRVICDSSLTYLSACIPRNLVSLKQLKPGPLLQFISQHWLSHLRQCEEEMFPTILAFESQRSNILHAVQLTSVIGDRGGGSEYDVKCCEALWKIQTTEGSRLGSYTPAIHIASALDLSHVLQLTLADGVDPNLSLQVNGLTPLSLSAMASARQAIRVLLGNARADTTVTDKEGHCPLALASIAGSYESVKLLLDCDATNINSTNRCLETPLIHAAKHGHISIAQELLRRVDVDVNAQDHKGRTALMVALEKGGLNKDIIISLFLDPRLDFEKRDHRGQTVSHAVASYGSSSRRLHPEILVMFYRVGRNLFSEHTSVPFLVFLAQNNYIGAFKMIIEQFPDSIDINAGDGKGGTPLFHAAMHGWIDLVRVLLDSPNISVNARDHNGQTPLMKAVEEGYDNIVDVLLAASVELDAVDNDGRTALMLAIPRAKTDTSFVTCIMQILDAGANPHIEDKNHRTALWYADTYGMGNVFVMLLHCGAIVHSRPRNLQIPLIEAVSKDIDQFPLANRESLRSIIMQLIQHGASVDWTDEELKTPLVHAIIASPFDPYLSSFLLELDADPNIPDFAGRTALSYAAEFGSDQLVKLLLDKGADPDIFDFDVGWSPLAYYASRISACWYLDQTKASGGDRDRTLVAYEEPLQTLQLLLKQSQLAVPIDLRKLGVGFSGRRHDQNPFLEWIASGWRTHRGDGQPTSLGREDLIRFLEAVISNNQAMEGVGGPPSPQASIKDLDV